MWLEKTEAASRVRTRIETVLDMVISADLRESENPARLAILKFLLLNQGQRPTVQHHNAMPYEQISDFMFDIRGQNGLSASALALIFLTATRTSEALNAKWDEINLDDRIWSTPAARMKAVRDYRVPLTAPAVTLLKDLGRIDGDGL